MPTLEEHEYLALMKRGQEAERAAQLAWTAGALTAAVTLSWAIGARSPGLMIPVVFAIATGFYGMLRGRQQARAVARAEFDHSLRTLDLLSTPTMPGAAPALGVPAPTRFTAPFNLLGWPALSVPVGTSGEGLPLGLQLVGRPWQEGAVLRAARQRGH